MSHACPCVDYLFPDSPFCCSEQFPYAITYIPSSISLLTRSRSRIRNWAFLG